MIGADRVDVLSVVLGIGTALGGGGSVFLWLETRTQGARDRRAKALKTDIAAALQPIQTDITALHTRWEGEQERMAVAVKIAIAESLEPVRGQLAVLNTKVEPLWTALINMGINQANVLHQPDPRRADVDKLLEELQTELRGGREMTADHFLRLQHYLILIRQWEPGTDIGFPVLPAEPTSAAILLAIMGLSRIRRKQEKS
jgi:hypothetical protein